MRGAAEQAGMAWHGMCTTASSMPCPCLPCHAVTCTSERRQQHARPGQDTSGERQQHAMPCHAMLRQTMPCHAMAVWPTCRALSLKQAQRRPRCSRVAAGAHQVHARGLVWVGVPQHGAMGHHRGLVVAPHKHDANVAESWNIGGQGGGVAPPPPCAFGHDHSRHMAWHAPLPAMPAHYPRPSPTCAG